MFEDTFKTKSHLAIDINPVCICWNISNLVFLCDQAMDAITAHITYTHTSLYLHSTGMDFFSPWWWDNDPHRCVRFLISRTATIAANCHLKDKAAVIEVSVSPAALQDDVSACAPGSAIESAALFVCMWLVPPSHTHTHTRRYKADQGRTVVL